MEPKFHYYIHYRPHYTVLCGLVPGRHTRATLLYVMYPLLLRCRKQHVLSESSDVFGGCKTYYATAPGNGNKKTDDL
jgi:hypothetical protein